MVRSSSGGVASESEMICRRGKIYFDNGFAFLMREQPLRVAGLPLALDPFD